MFSGFSGYLSLGHAVFYGTGAYFLVVAAQDWNLTGAAVFWLVPLGGLAAAIIAVPLGLVALRVRRHTFVVITIAFFFIAQLSASNLGVTGGSSGLLVPVADELGPGHLQQPVLLPGPDPRGGARWRCPGWSGGPGSGCSSAPSATTRTAPLASASGPCRSS